MSLPFTNTHTHVFNTLCAPDNFLRIVPSKTIRHNSAFVKKMLDSRFRMFIMNQLFRIATSETWRERTEWNKYITFLSVSTAGRHVDIFVRGVECAEFLDPTRRRVG